MSKVLLYGAYGYTGKLILDELLTTQVCRPLIVGRDVQKIEKLAESYKLDFDVAEVESFGELLKKHSSVDLVINAAGPYIYTAQEIAVSCVEVGVHYIDVTGEISVFNQLHALDKAARKAGVMLLPGTGFDVAPTDCLANALKKKMPDATHLELAFANVGAGASRGTLLTSVLSLETTTLIRAHGVLEPVAWKTQQREINFGPFKRYCVAIPWGDLATAAISAGFENIKVFMPMKPKMVIRLPLITTFLRIPLLKRLALRWVRQKVTGPTKELRDASQTHVVGKVWNKAGDKIEMRLQTANGYTFTAQCTAWVTQSILNGKLIAGYQTPSMAYGYNFIKEIKAVIWKND